MSEEMNRHFMYQKLNIKNKGVQNLKKKKCITKLICFFFNQNIMHGFVCNVHHNMIP